MRWRATASSTGVRFPSLVEATDGDGTVRGPLSPRFQDLIDAVAMREGATESEAYLEGWGQAAETERPGDAETVAEAVAAELEGASRPSSLAASSARPASSRRSAVAAVTRVAAIIPPSQ